MFCLIQVIFKAAQIHIHCRTILRLTEMAIRLCSFFTFDTEAITRRRAETRRRATNVLYTYMSLSEFNLNPFQSYSIGSYFPNRDGTKVPQPQSSFSGELCPEISTEWNNIPENRFIGERKAWRALPGESALHFPISLLHFFPQIYTISGSLLPLFSFYLSRFSKH